MNYTATIITPTLGRVSLLSLITSIKDQDCKNNIQHIILLDKNSQNIDPNFFEDDFYKPVVLSLKDSYKNGMAPGSALRSIGMMAALGRYIMFADDDVVWDSSHLRLMLKAIVGREWAYTKRKVFSPQGEYLGIDEFESVGFDSVTPYNMIDNNCLIVSRNFATGAAPLYRETQEYNDDRLMFQYLSTYAGEYGSTKTATINHTCPEHLVDFFRINCTKE